MNGIILATQLVNEEIISETVDKIVVMVQKEVGDRFKAKEGSKDYSSLSILFNYHYTITKLMDISRNVFIPKPNVDSIVLTMNKRLNKEYIKDINIFYKLIRDAFKYKRKNIRNNLKDYNLNLIEYFLYAFFFSLIVSPLVISLVKREKIKQTILHYVDGHKSKNGTPTMGGIIFLISISYQKFTRQII